MREDFDQCSFMVSRFHDSVMQISRDVGAGINAEKVLAHCRWLSYRWIGIKQTRLGRK